MKSKTITTRVPVNTLAEINKFCAEAGVTRTELILSSIDIVMRLRRGIQNGVPYTSFGDLLRIDFYRELLGGNSLKL